MERKVDYEVTAKVKTWRHERFLACISSNHEIAQNIIRKTARLASYYNSKWYVLYVQTPKESSDKIPWLHNVILSITLRMLPNWEQK